MEVTEVRVKMVSNRQDKLKAFCSVTFDNAFVVRDIKVIEGNNGLFVAMPSRKLTIRCTRCAFKNQVRSNYCNDCGTEIPIELSERAEEGRTKLHADVAHPINSDCRTMIQNRIIEEYEGEKLNLMVPADVSEAVELSDAPAFDQGPAVAEEPFSTVETMEPSPLVADRVFREDEPEPEPGPSGEEEESKSSGDGMPPPEDNFSAGIF
ncbi:MAG TPA: stage V sporulation protein G [Planctomycetes bacterium]|nr:stage V sporulation protein G [Planctomycetota bacterium]HIN79699.1 stage V sporulation protein G [Planctomycetota bacterium]